MNHIHVCIELFIIPSEIWGVYTDHGYLKKGETALFEPMGENGDSHGFRETQTGPLIG